MDTLFESLGKIAGIAGLSIGLILVIFREVVRKNIFPNLTKQQSYRLIRLIILLSFITGIVGLAIWFIPQIVYPTKTTSLITNSDTLKIETNINNFQEIEKTFFRGNLQYDSLALLDVGYDKVNKAFDLKFRNFSNTAAFITKVRFTVYYFNAITFGKVEPMDTLDFTVDTRLITKSNLNKQPLYFDTTKNVSYSIPSNDVGRLLFSFDLNSFKPYYPPDGIGNYRLAFTITYNASEHKTFGFDIGHQNVLYPNDFQ